MADLKDLINDLKQQESAIRDDYSFKSVIGLELSNSIIDNFEKQAYVSGNATQYWENRSPKANQVYGMNKFYRGTPYKARNPILIQSKSLLRSVGWKVRGSTIGVGILDGTNPYHGSSIPAYGKLHNEGLRSNWKVIKKNIKLPKRQFMPTPYEDLNPRMKKIIQEIWDRRAQRIMSKFSRL